MASICNFLRSLCAYPKPEEKKANLVNTDFHTIIADARKQINEDSINAVNALFMDLVQEIRQQNESASKNRKLPSLIPHVSYQKSPFNNFGFLSTQEEIDSMVTAIRNATHLKKDSRRTK